MRRIFNEIYYKFSKNLQENNVEITAYINQLAELDNLLGILDNDLYRKLYNGIYNIRKIFGQKKNITIVSGDALYHKLQENVLAIYEQLKSIKNLQALLVSWLEIEIPKFNKFINKNQSIHDSIKIKIREHVKASVDVSNEDMKTRLENKTLESLNKKFNKKENDYIFEFHYFRRLFYLFSQVDPDKLSGNDLHTILCSDIGHFDESYFEEKRIGTSFLAFDFYRINLKEFGNSMPSLSSEFVEFFKTNISSIEKYAGQFNSHFPETESEAQNQQIIS